jgi:hypothetical protein
MSARAFLAFVQVTTIRLGTTIDQGDKETLLSSSKAPSFVIGAAQYLVKM